jgi:hypothetical protein
LIEDAGEELTPFFDKELKKRGAEMLFWDVSYKEAKYLAKYHSLSLFKGLVAATNGFGEIRVQFHTITDSHDQYERPLEDI